MAHSNRQGLAVRRTAAAVVAGLVVLVVALVLGAAWPVALTGAWGVTALVIVVSVWVRIYPMDADQTRAHARAEDFSRPASDIAVLVASVASLGAIAYTVHRAGHAHGATKALLIALAVSVVSLSWLTVHTLYLLRYGDVYYGEPVGGIDFNDDEPPDYRDFAYLAFTIGMTYQVSDTTLRHRRIRRTVLWHALMSYVFGVVIVAGGVSLIAGLLY